MLGAGSGCIERVFCRTKTREEGERRERDRVREFPTVRKWNKRYNGPKGVMKERNNLGLRVANTFRLSPKQ